MFFCCFLRFAICICTLILQFSLNYLTSGLACFFYLYIFTALHFLSRFHFICIFSLCRRNAKQICRFTLTDIIVSVDKHAYIQYIGCSIDIDIAIIMILYYCSGSCCLCIHKIYVHFIVRIFMICKLFIYLFN